MRKILSGNLICLILLSVAASPAMCADNTPAQLAATEAQWAKRKPFYKKHVVVGGMLIMSSDKVSDAALAETAKLTRQMLAGRPDLLAVMVKRGACIMVVGANEGITDLPEYRWLKPKAFWDERSRGFGGGNGKLKTSCAEENMLCLPDDLYEEENIFIHEFAHTIHEAINLADKEKKFDKKLTAAYENALKKGLWRCSYKDMYAIVTIREYWAEGVQSWFDANNENNFKHNHINTRQELKTYDPDLAKLVEETFALTEKNDWRYKAPAKRPQVAAPSDALKCDPFYRKHVRARGLAILGSDKAPDAALLEANRIVRRMFAYRHDLLRAMFKGGLRVVVVGENEKTSDVPELKDAGDTRTVNCTIKRKIIACGAESLLGEKNGSVLIGQLARAMHLLTGLREIDEKLGKDLAKYKTLKRRFRSSVRLLRSQIGVRPIDKRFDAELKLMHKRAIARGLWKDTPAAKNHVNYWVQGAESWFDAGAGKINTREKLEAYDADLAKLAARVFCHAERVDWRYKSPPN